MKYQNIERTFILRLTKEENMIFEQRFIESGMSTRSEFLRFLIRYGCIYKVDYSYLQDYAMQLQKIGTNINQIAHKVNSTGDFYAPDLEYLQGELKKIWQLQKSMLSNEPLINQ